MQTSPQQIIFFISSVSIMNGYIQGRMKIQFEISSFHLTYYEIDNSNDANFILEEIKTDKEIKYTNIYRETKLLLTANQVNTGLAYFRSVPENIFNEDAGFNEVIRLIDGKKSINENEIFISKKTSEKLRVKVEIGRAHV